MTDHVWFRGGGLKFKRAGAGMKDRVSFKATVQMYARIKTKNPIQFEVEYGLKDPQEIIVLNKEVKKMQNKKEEGIKTYKNEYGVVEVRFDYLNTKVWLTMEEMSTLFGVVKTAISNHIRKIEKSGLFDLLVLTLEIFTLITLTWKILSNANLTSVLLASGKTFNVTLFSFCINDMDFSVMIGLTITS